MRGVLVLVSHPDFLENDDQQAEAFVEGVQRGWGMVKKAQSFDDDMELVVAGPVAPDTRVRVWFPYGERMEIRRAEEAVAATIATVSFHVAHMNHTGMQPEIVPAYGFEIVRDVEAPVA